MARVLVLGSFAESLVNFRGALLRDFVSLGHKVYACAPNASKEIQDKLSQLGVEYRDVYLSRTGVNPVDDVRTFLSFYNLMRRTKPDIFLGYTIKPVVYGSLAARLTGVSGIFSIITGLGYAFSCRNLRQRFVGAMVRVLYKISLNCNKKIYFQNPDDCNYFNQLRLLRREDQAVLINGSGVNVSDFKITPVPTDVSFLLIARLLKDKGIYEYVEAARIVKAKYPEIVFRLVGWIDENPDSIKKSDLNSWIVDGIIDYLGKLDDVRPALTASSVYVLPSYREGTPRTVLEAMAMGRPIVTTDAPGCRETVKEGENGFLVPLKDVNALACAMERFILQPELIEKMGRRSREIAIEKYDVHKVNAVIMKTMGLHSEKII